MAFLWLSYDAEGMSVQETAAEVVRLFEDEEHDSDWVPLTLVTSAEEDPYKTIYVDCTRVLAIEQGMGYFDIPEEEEIARSGERND